MVCLKLPRTKVPSIHHLPCMITAWLWPPRKFLCMCAELCCLDCCTYTVNGCVFRDVSAETHRVYRLGGLCFMPNWHAQCLRRDICHIMRLYVGLLEYCGFHLLWGAQLICIIYLRVFGLCKPASWCIICKFWGRFVEISVIWFLLDPSSLLTLTLYLWKRLRLLGLSTCVRLKLSGNSKSAYLQGFDLNPKHPSQFKVPQCQAFLIVCVFHIVRRPDAQMLICNSTRGPTVYRVRIWFWPTPCTCTVEHIWRVGTDSKFAP